VITIANFTNTLDKNQVAKGKVYYKDDAVEYLSENKPDCWQAEVSGTELYHVKVQLNSIEVVNTRCDCPHEDPFCKHIVAVLFALQDKLDIAEEGAPKQEKKKTGTKKKAVTVEDLLQQVNEVDLKKFVKEAVRKNKDFRNLFMLRFQYTNDADSYEKYAAMIRDNAKVYTRRGFIDYYESKKALDAALNIADEAELSLGNGNYRIVFDASRAIIKEVQEMLHSMDDSNGLAGDCIDRSFSYLANMAENADVPVLLRHEIFEYAFSEFGKPYYRDFGFDSGMRQLMIAASVDHEQLHRALDKINVQLKIADNEYRQKELLDAKIELLNRSGKQQEAFQIVADNLQHWEFREAMILKCINDKNFEKAKIFASDAVKTEQVKGWQGNKKRWEEWLLTIAIKENDTVTIRKYSKQFYFDCFDQKYYTIYKATFSTEEWNAECNEWIKWFLSKGRISIPEQYALANIYIAEKKFDRLLILLQKNPDYEFAKKCGPYLQEEYAKKLIEIYRQALLNYALNNTGRNNYVELRKRLKEVQKMGGGKPLVKELVEYFLRMHKNRPAMIDELNKINV